MPQQVKPHPLFPVNMQAKWRSEKSVQLPANLRDWLLDPSSLTARLKRHCNDFHVEVLGQKIEPCAIEEATAEVAIGQEVLIREVLLFCGQQPQVFARSLLPLSSLTGAEKQLANLGNQSLGQVLFNHPQLQRKRIEVASFDNQSSVACLAKHHLLTSNEGLWGRRSVFYIEDKPLIVAEVFLPEAFAYQLESII